GVGLRSSTRVGLGVGLTRRSRVARATRVAGVAGLHVALDGGAALDAGAQGTELSFGVAAVAGVAGVAGGRDRTADRRGAGAAGAASAACVGVVGDVAGLARPGLGARPRARVGAADRTADGGGVTRATRVAGVAGLGTAVETRVALEGGRRIGVAEGVAELAGVTVGADRRGL